MSEKDKRRVRRGSREQKHTGHTNRFEQMTARWTLSLPQTNRANPVQCCSTHQTIIKSNKKGVASPTIFFFLLMLMGLYLEFVFGLCLMPRRFAAALRTLGLHTPPAAVILRRQALWRFPDQSTLRRQPHAQHTVMNSETHHRQSWTWNILIAASNCFLYPMRLATIRFFLICVFQKHKSGSLWKFEKRTFCFLFCYFSILFCLGGFLRIPTLVMRMLFCCLVFISIVQSGVWSECCPNFSFVHRHHHGPFSTSFFPSVICSFFSLFVFIASRALRVTSPWGCRDSDFKIARSLFDTHIIIDIQYSFIYTKIQIFVHLYKNSNNLQQNARCKHSSCSTDFSVFAARTVCKRAAAECSTAQETCKWKLTPYSLFVLL